MGQKWAAIVSADNPLNSEVLKFTDLAGRGGMGDKTYRKSGSEAIQLPESKWIAPADAGAIRVVVNNNTRVNQNKFGFS